MYVGSLSAGTKPINAKKRVITPGLLGSRFILNQLSVAAAAAYGERKLLASATNANNVRRSQDNATLDVGFVGEDLNTQVLLDFVGYENLFAASQSFVSGVSGWTIGAGASTSNNATTAPNGTTTGAQLNSNNVASNFTYQQVNAAGIKTISLYAKQNSFRYLWLYGGTTGVNYGVLFDLQTGTVATSNTNGAPTGTTNSISDAGNGWRRCSITYDSTLNIYQAFTATNKTTHTYSANNDITDASTGGSIYIWGAQGQNSATLAPHQITTGTAWTSFNGFVVTRYDQTSSGYHVTQATALNQPRIVINGVLVTENTRPVIDFSGAATWLFNSAASADASLWGSNPQTMNMVGRSASTADRDGFSLLGGTALGTNLRSLGGPAASVNWRYTTGADISSGAVSGATLSIATGRYASSANDLRTNGVIRTTGSGAENSTAGSIVLGARTTTGSGQWGGVLGDCILFNQSISDADALLLERDEGRYFLISVP